jgi:hypothetical protein
MDRIISWVESSTLPTKFIRPPALRTSCTFDDDEVFTNVALNLLSRYEALGLSAEEAILATIISPRGRWSFLEGLNFRLTNPTRCSPTAASLIYKVDTTFGQELKRLVRAESYLGGNCAVKRQGGFQPPSPRHIHPKTPASGSAMLHSSSSSSSSTMKSKGGRRFFPDSECLSKSFFRSKRVENIDWHLVEAIEQVQTLQLDGTEPVARSRSDLHGCYRPPTSPLRPRYDSR